MSRKLTEWFPADVTPALVGVYEVRDSVLQGSPYKWWAYWDGKKFCYRGTDPNSAFQFRNLSTSLPWRTKWRGLAQDPSKRVKQ